MIRHPMQAAAGLAAALCVAGSARAAGTPDQAVAEAVRPAVAPAQLRTPLILSYGQAKAAQARSALPAGVAKTAVDHRFSPDDALVGQVGFLCGLSPDFNENGGAASDPQGRFLGVKLSYALK